MMLKTARLAAVAALLLFTFQAIGAELQIACSSQILSASHSGTVMSFEFDEATIQDRAVTMSFGESISDGLGELIAIPGHGQPYASVSAYELGDVMQAVPLDTDELPAYADGLVLLSDPVVMNELRLVSVNPVPVMRDANGMLRTVRRLEVEISTTGAGENEIPEPVSFSHAWYPIYRDLVRNLDELYPELASRPPGRYVILITDNLLTTMGQAAAWVNFQDLKRRKGYTVQVYTTRDVWEAVNDTTYSGIRLFMSQQYSNGSMPSLDYALVVAPQTSSFGIAAHLLNNPENGSESSVGDNDFFTVNGNDYIADILHGRVPGNSIPEMLTYFNKVIQYETNPFRDDPAWFSSASFVAGNYADAGGTYPVTPVWNMAWARERIMRDGCITNADTFFFHDLTDPPPRFYTQAMINDMNSGVCAVLYRGWGDTQCWKYPEFCVTDANQLAVGRRNFAAFGIVCGTGRFHLTEPCLGWKLTCGLGSPTNPNGAIVFYGASDLHTNTRHNNAILAGMVRALLVEGIRSTGGLAIAGEMEAYRQFPRERDPNGFVRYYVFHAFNILGDPETPLMICQPAEFSVNAPAQLTAGESLIPVTVMSSGQPVTNAVVTVRSAGSTTVGADVTNSDGQAWIPIVFDGPGTAQLTVWKGKHFMHLSDIPIASAPYDPQVQQVSWIAGDDYLPNPGEQVGVILSIRNLGSDASSYSISISSLDSRATVTLPDGTVENTPPGEIRTSSALGVLFGSEIYDGESIRFSAVISNGSANVTREFVVPVSAPDPQVISLAVNDGGNGILEPGETADIAVTVQNVGHTRATGLTAQIYSWDSAISFENTDAAWPDIEIGGTAQSTNHFRATLAQGVTHGRQINLRFSFAQIGDAVLARKHAWLTAGVVSPSAPTGPDAYGYYAYENIDVGFTKTPVYDWIELDPWRGGSGATPHEVGDDTHFDMDLPAPFTFYGQTYSHVWICSNGWISFESAAIPEFRNWEIPSPIGPGAMICGFWDDLVGDSVGPTPPNDLYNVYTRYDGGQNRFIIEWRNWNRESLPSSPGVPNPDSCSFEIILEYDDEGDDDILVQYRIIANTDVLDNYATIGIQDSYHERGLNLTYANYYLPTVDTIRAQRAIRFTTTPPDNFTDADDLPSLNPAQFALHEAYPNPFNPVTELKFDLSANAFTTLKVYDMLGREVAVLVNETRPAGSYAVKFDANELATGLYFARLVSGGSAQVRKLMLVK